MRVSSVISALLFGLTDGCSNFYMGYTDPSYRLSARTVDLPVELDVVIHTFPKGRQANVHGTRWTSLYGYLGFSLMSREAVDTHFSPPPPKGGIDFGDLDIVAEGMNTQGLSCALQLFAGAKMEPFHPSNPQKNIFSLSFCKWALERYATVEEVKNALKTFRFVQDAGVHFVVQDAGQKTIVVEFIDGSKRIHEDMNDGVNTFGILTNQPSFEWHTENVKLLQWKQSLARTAVSVPGNWYPDDRYLRIHLVKSAVERTKQPTTYQQAVAQTVAVLNTITVPMGDLEGTGGTTIAGGLPSHTLGGLIRDHQNSIYFFRSETNPSFRRINLLELPLEEGEEVQEFDVDEDPYFAIDVSWRRELGGDEDVSDEEFDYGLPQLLKRKSRNPRK